MPYINRNEQQNGLAVCEHSQKPKPRARAPSYFLKSKNLSDSVPIPLAMGIESKMFIFSNAH
jgi:hypothetical protein